MQETRVWSLGWEDSLEKGKATHSSIFAWRIPWTGELGGLQSMGSQRAGHDWATNPITITIDNRESKGHYYQSQVSAFLKAAAQRSWEQGSEVWATAAEAHFVCGVGHFVVGRLFFSFFLMLFGDQGLKNRPFQQQQQTWLIKGQRTWIAISQKTVNKLIKICSTSLIIREMQTKTTMRYHLTPLKIATIKTKTKAIK